MEYESQPTQGLPVVSPANMLPVQVIHREVIAPDVVSVFIVLPGARQAPAPYLPGQFVTLALPTPRETLYRSYSLCGDGDMSRPWELTIKRMEMGAVSTYFYDSVQRGTLLYSSLPRGTFTMPARVGPKTPLVMVALGSGITPIMGMLRAVNRMPADEQPPVHLHYASRSADVEIFGDELEMMDREQRWLSQWAYYSEQGARLTPEVVMARSGRVARRAHWYMCGPESVKQNLQASLDHLGVARSLIHSEVFATKSGPAYVVESGESGVGGRITIAETGATLDAQPRETLLTALERQGYHPEFSCRVGACGACKLKVLAGQVNPVGEALSDADRAEGYVLSCIAHPIGDVTLQSGGAAGGMGRSASGGHAGARALVRLGAVVGVSALLFTTWNLTDHRPASWAQAQSSVSGSSGSGASPIVSPTASTQPSATAQPTATPKPTTSSSSSNPAPAPTATPKPAAPAPIAAPKPTPTCIGTPSKPC
ncbi:MAG TPA: 2Fe-2S iron-sulfur cluster-binding protein [Ktedonobacterales bacterium]|nr:2Fe-2S iron-sulfur cluster-binding protein [Ktedonobacterales bacterium]